MEGELIIRYHQISCNSVVGCGSATELQTTNGAPLPPLQILPSLITVYGAVQSLKIPWKLIMAASLGAVNTFVSSDLKLRMRSWKFLLISGLADENRVTASCNPVPKWKQAIGAAIHV